jgi:hypothetical protein
MMFEQMPGLVDYARWNSYHWFAFLETVARAGAMASNPAAGRSEIGSWSTHLLWSAVAKWHIHYDLRRTK